jgi:uncharacterized membrane protein YfcA
MEIYTYILAIGGGFFAGILNAIAGFGSVITLSIMIEFMGMPANLANGTNRINMFTQTSLSSLAYFRQGKLNFKKCQLGVILAFVGAMFGVVLALNISNEAFKIIFRYLLILMFLAVLVNPKRWIHETDLDYKMSKWISIPLFLLLGFYGGFIQMGMGLFTLIVLVLIAKLNIVEANAIKVFIIALYTLVLIFIFDYKGLIDWRIGLTFALGQGIGGYLAAYYASKYSKADVWIYRILIITVLIVILKSFGIIHI